MRKNTFLLICFGLFLFYLTGCENNSGNLNTTNRNTSNAANNSTPLNSNLSNSSNNSNTANMNSASSNNNTATVTSPDNSFLMEASQGGMAEVELGKLAASKAQSPEVKKFGEKMVSDHTKANNELKALAAKKGVVLPAELSSSQKSELEKLKGLSGADFDKEYVELMVDDHEEDVDAFQSQADGAKDADIKAFAAKTLPTLKSHLEMIKNISSKMK